MKVWCHDPGEPLPIDSTEGSLLVAFSHEQEDKLNKLVHIRCREALWAFELADEYRQLNERGLL